MRTRFLGRLFLLATLPLTLGADGTAAPANTPASGSASSAPTVAHSTPQPTAAKAATRPGQTRTPLPPGARAARLAWWNHPGIVEAIGLSAQQRAEMDLAVARHTEAHLSAVENRQTSGVAFQNALKSGDWEAARKHASNLRNATAEGWHNQALLKIDILQLLSKEQREKFVAKYPDMLTSPWMNPAMRRNLRRGGPPRNAAGEPGCEAKP